MTHPENHRCPVRLVDFNGTPVVYELVDEFETREQPYQAGGTMTYQAPTGRKLLQARELSRVDVLPLTPALVAAIVLEERRQAQKQGAAGAGVQA